MALDLPLKDRMGDPAELHSAMTRAGLSACPNSDIEDLWDIWRAMTDARWNWLLAHKMKDGGILADDA